MRRITVILNCLIPLVVVSSPCGASTERDLTETWSNAIEQAGVAPENGPAAASAQSAGKNVLLITSPPYNARCDAATGTLSMKAGSPVTSGYAFQPADVGKTLTAGGVDPSGASYRLMATISAVSGGNATLSTAPETSFAATSGHWTVGTNDQKAIQAAFNDALRLRYSVQFPAGTCLTGTIDYRGQSFFGAGMNLTTVLGMPGQDVFASQDAALNLETGASIHDLTVAVDTSINKASTAVGGDNTFPNRISGTAGGLSPLKSPPLTGGIEYGKGPITDCFGKMTSGSTTFILGCINFKYISPTFYVGQPITVSGAGAAGATLSTKVTAVSSQTTLTLATPASTTVAAASGTIGAVGTVATTPPWYFGNCGIALPASSGAALANFSWWVLRNVSFQAAHRSYNGENYSCAMFMQANGYDNAFENITVTGFWGGLIEAPPASNNTSYYAWTPDTNVYNNVTLQWNVLPMVLYNGNHRVGNGVSIYSLNSPFLLGLFQFGVPLGSSHTNYPSFTINRYYNECNSWQGGEIARFSGIDTINGGSLAQCPSPGYINWMAGQSTVDAQVGVKIHIAGDHNTFKNAAIQTSQVTDTGYENRVMGGVNSAIPSSKREFNVDPIPQQEPLGKLDAGFLVAGSTATPFVSSSDLLTTCKDYFFATSGTWGQSCVNDAGGAELTKTYIHNPGSTGFFTQGAARNYGDMTVGNRIPPTNLYVVTQGMCEGTTSCSATFAITDLTTGSNLKTCNVTYGSKWTIQGGPTSASPCLVNLSAITPGDVIGWGYGRFSGNPTGVNVSFVAFDPVNTDVLAEAHASLSGGTLALSTAPIAARTCGPVQKVTVANATTAMTPLISGAGVLPSAVPGYGAGGLQIDSSVTAANTVSVQECNSTGADIKPGPLTVNVRVIQ